jgi:hypothetical protein
MTLVDGLMKIRREQTMAARRDHLGALVLAEDVPLHQPPFTVLLGGISRLAAILDAIHADHGCSVQRCSPQLLAPSS